MFHKSATWTPGPEMKHYKTLSEIWEARKVAALEYLGARTGPEVTRAHNALRALDYLYERASRDGFPDDSSGIAPMTVTPDALELIRETAEEAAPGDIDFYGAARDLGYTSRVADEANEILTRRRALAAHGVI